MHIQPIPCLQKWLLPLLILAITHVGILAQNEQTKKRTPTHNKMASAFDISYDLRGCEASFEIIWQYYQNLAAQKGLEGKGHGKTFSDFQMLQTGKGLGRFASRQVIPNRMRFERNLGASKQTFAILLWRKRGRDRAFVFTVQRSLDPYGKNYYPFTIYESFAFPWPLWNKQNPKIRCDQALLWQSIPKP